MSYNKEVKVVATPRFVRLAKKILAANAVQELVDLLAMHPEKGVLIPNVGGIRKIRWQTGKNNKGKSGGVRILYYFDRDLDVILLISLYAKSDQENLNAGERELLKKLLPELLNGDNNEQIR